MEVRQPIAGVMTKDPELKAMDTVLQALQSLDEEARRPVIAWVASRLSVTLAASSPDAIASGSSGAAAVELGTFKAFVAHKSPKDDVARATTLAYYLAHARSQSTFTTADLTKARVEAALSSFNVSRAVGHAQRAGHVTTAGRRGVYHITSTGESVIDAMPDPERLKAVKSATAGRRRPARPSGRRKKAAARKT